MARWAHRRVLRVILSVATLALMLGTYAAAIASPANVAAATRSTLSTPQGRDAATRALAGALRSGGVAPEQADAHAAAALGSDTLDSALAATAHGGSLAPARDALVAGLAPSGLPGSLPGLDRAVGAVGAGAGTSSAAADAAPRARSGVLSWVAPRAGELASLGATAATVALVVVLVTAPKRRAATMRSAGRWALLSCGVPVVLVLVAAPLAGVIDAPAAAQFLAFLARPLFAPVMGMWVAIAVAGGALAFGARFVGLVRPGLGR